MGLGLLSRRRIVGLALAVVLLLGGRLVRYRMLVDPDGEWREHLWLDSLLSDPAAALAAAKPPRPVLTDPLPINTCSRDSLILLPGVGPVLAERIDAARLSGVVFRTAADLRVVKGIGPSLSARLDTLLIYAISPAPDSLSRNMH